ncbi:MAG TPA: VOC family protein [Candidatus Binatia bacterium]
MGPIKVNELDHIVLNVSHVDRALEFYTGVLGLAGERVPEYREGKVGFPSVRINERTVIDLNPKGKRGGEGGKDGGNLDHFCLVMDPVDFGAVLGYLKEKRVLVKAGPVSRWGARGRATSVYILDPEGNEIELRCY